MPCCLVEVYGEEQGRRLDLRTPPYTLGRVEGNAIVVRSASVSRQHAVVARNEYGYTVTDSGSTNGTFVNDTRVKHAPLNHGDYLKVGSTVFRVLACADLDEAYAHELERLNRIDGLTQLLRGDAFVGLLDERIRRAGGELALILIETEALDDMRRRYGNAASDRVLSLLAGLLQQRVRQADLLARYDEARFALLLDGTGSHGATRVAEKLRRFVALSTFRYNDTPIPVRVRTGVSVVARDLPVSARRLIEQAVAALG
jgi:diguanylate cyclase (GGDEF)-like protein